MRRRILARSFLISWVAICAFIAIGACALAQNQSSAPAPPADTQPSLQQSPTASATRAVRLSGVQGTVQVFKDGEIDFDQARLNMPVVQGMRFITSNEGRAEIQFEDGSVARITPNSSLTIATLSRSAGGATVTVIKADTGLTYYELNGQGGDYTVKFGEDGIAPNDGSVFRLDLDSTPVLAVMHGSVHISNEAGLSANVHTNQSARFDSTSANEYQLVESVAANSWDQWNSDRDEALAELDQSATEARAATGNPDNPAWSDLDAYGYWYDLPGYGTGWAPAGVGADWDPYGFGYWGYYSGIGYTWISGYPWGWWPYRCGAWSWFDGFGWMWFPGNCGWAGGVDLDEEWYPYAVIWTVPVGYHCPHRPSRIHRPGHHRPPAQPLIAVDRGSQFMQLYHSVGVQKARARTFQFEGKNISPIRHTARPRQSGPPDEGFTDTLDQTNPDVMVRQAYRGAWYTPNGSSGGEHQVYRPSPAYMPPARTGGAVNEERAPVYAPRRAPEYNPPAGPRSFGRPSGPPPAPRAEPMRAAPPIMNAPAAHPAGHSQR